MERLTAIWRWLEALASWSTLSAVADILLVAFLIYQAMAILRGRRAASVVAGLIVVAAAYQISVQANLVLLRALLETLAPYAPLALIVVFQNEIRRGLTRLGEQGWRGVSGRVRDREVYDDLLFAVRHLASRRIGALCVIERDVGLKTFIESGVPLDAVVTSELLITIFEPGKLLHDGAVIIRRNGRVAAAACFLPLSINPEVSRKYGTRHRAALGVTEESDCLSIVVSEETGMIAISEKGEIFPNVSLDDLARKLGRPPLPPPAVQTEPSRAKPEQPVGR